MPHSVRLRLLAGSLALSALPFTHAKAQQVTHAKAQQAPAQNWEGLPMVILEQVYRGPLPDTVIQRWRDPVNSGNCYMYLPVSAPLAAPQPGSNSFQYGPNIIGSISCVNPTQLVQLAPAPEAIRPGALGQLGAPAPAPAAAPTQPRPSAPAPAPVAAPPPPRIDPDKPRVVIRVRGESWVQIRDNPGNRVLMDRVLRAGEIIEIPNRPGIVLTTGKAESLEILLDGQDVDPFGGPGVRRNIALEPDRLRPPPTQANTPAPVTLPRP